MHLIAVIGFCVFGLLAIAAGIVHEVSWWRRRHWRKAQGIIVGFKEEQNDGISYFPEIEVQDPSRSFRFFSRYGTGRKPTVGDSVTVLVNDSGDSAEQIKGTNRILFTVVPLIFGLICIIVGLTVRPIPEGEQDAGKQPPSRSEAK